MKVRMAYCSACDRDVQIALEDEPTWTDGQANIRDTEVVCLEIGRQCTGALCPIGAQPPTVMAVRLVRSGLKPIIHPIKLAHCDACDEVTRFALIDRKYATCTVCGATTDHIKLATPTSN